jgi:single-strand DNA-binding protein
MAGETIITLVGRVVDDTVDLRFTPGGAAVAKFRIASNARKFDKNTNTWIDEEPLFLTVNVWRQQAEQVAETLAKGMRVVVQGQLRQRSYDTKEGEKRTVYEVEAEEVAVSLKFATATVTPANRQGGGQQERPQGQQNNNWGGQNQQQGQGGWGAPQGQSGPPQGQQNGWGGNNSEAPF